MSNQLASSNAPQNSTEFGIVREANVLQFEWSYILCTGVPIGFWKEFWNHLKIELNLPQLS